MRRDLEGGDRQSILVTQSTGYKGEVIVIKKKGGDRSASGTSLTVCESDETSATRVTKTPVKSISKWLNLAKSHSPPSSLLKAKEASE